MANKSESRIDRLVTYWVDRYTHAKNAWLKANPDPEDKALIGTFGQSPMEMSKWNDAERQRIAQVTSWIYAAMRLLAQGVSAAPLSIQELQGETKVAVKNHPAELLFANPNPYVDLRFIWQYTVMWMQLTGDGYWFLAPAQGDEKTIIEIWPVPSDRIEALPSKTDFLAGYAYKMPSGEKKFIKPEYIVHFQYPNVFALLDGFAPLSAAQLALETELGTASWQRDTYVTGKGVPHSIIALNPDTSERDFIAISTQIREEFEQERKIIVTRSGDLKVDKVGLSQKEMELIAQREFTRDELDIVFLGFALHSQSAGRELATIYKMFREETIFPLHQMLSGQLSKQFVKPRYGNQFFAEFDDIRAQDRSLNVQERNVYWRVKTLNEARAELILPPIDEGEFEGLGSMLVMLATDPQFMMANYGIGIENLRPNTEGIVEPKRKKPVPNSAMDDADAPVNVLSDSAKDVKLLMAPSVAELTGLDTELKRFQKVAVKSFKSGIKFIPFSSEVIPSKNLYALKGLLLESKSEDEVKQVFTDFKADLRNKRGRGDKPTLATNAYQIDLGDNYDEWVEKTADLLYQAEDKKSVIDERLALLLLLLIALGRKTLPDALDLAVGENGQSPEMVDKLGEALRNNESYLRDSLIPAISAKLQKALEDPDIQLAIQSGEGKEVIKAILSTMGARVESYATEFWKLYNWGIVLSAKELGKPLKAFLDSQAQHCSECPQFHTETGKIYASFQDYLNTTSNRVPGSYECKSGCRCWLVVTE